MEGSLVVALGNQWLVPFQPEHADIVQRIGDKVYILGFLRKTQSLPVIGHGEIEVVHLCVDPASQIKSSGDLLLVFKFLRANFLAQIERLLITGKGVFVFPSQEANQANVFTSNCLLVQISQAFKNFECSLIVGERLVHLSEYLQAVAQVSQDLG